MSQVPAFNALIFPPDQRDPVWGLLGRPPEAVLRSRELSLQWKDLCERAEKVWSSKRGPARLKKWQAIEHTKQGFLQLQKETVDQ